MVRDLCFEILDKCPNKCMFCSSNSCIDKNTFISLDDFKRTINYFMANGGIEELSLSGGEPLMHPDLLELIDIIDANRISFLNFVPQGRGKENQESLKLTDAEKKEFF